MFEQKVVQHVTFGKGTIIEEKGDYLNVQFEQSKEVKKFLYPVSFAKFLTFEDKKCQKKANDLLLKTKLMKEQKQEEQAKKIEKIKEDIKQQKLEKLRKQRKLGKA